MLRRDKLRPLVVLNVLLALAVGVTAWARPRAVAQGEGGGETKRLRGEYTLVGAKTNQGGANAIWILDSANSEMVVLKWDQSRQVLIGAGYRNIAGDARQSPGR